MNEVHLVPLGIRSIVGRKKRLEPLKLPEKEKHLDRLFFRVVLGTMRFWTRLIFVAL